MQFYDASLQSRPNTCYQSKDNERLKQRQTGCGPCSIYPKIFFIKRQWLDDSLHCQKRLSRYENQDTGSNNGSSPRVQMSMAK